MAEERIGKTLKEKVFDCVFDERVSPTQVIVRIYDPETKESEKRVMDRGLLRQIGIKHEGEFFSIHVRRYEDKGQELSETYLTRP